MLPIELSFNRRACERDLVETAIVRQNQGTTDSDYGGETPNYVNGPSYPCRVEAFLSTRQPGEIQIGSETQSRMMYRIVLPWDAVIDKEDIIRVNGIDFEVQGSNSHETERFTTVVNAVRLE